MTVARTLAIGVMVGGIGAVVAAQAPQTKTPPRAKAPAAVKAPATFGIGRAATADDIAKVDIDVHPDGTGLPAGSATSADGAPIFAAKCASCHGRTGKEGPNDRLVGRVPDDAFPFARDPRIPHTIGNYWPYATTVFDYIRRAMPPTEPGSLKDNDVYALTAYLLFLNDLIPADAVLDATSLPKVRMPSRDRFVPDPRGGPKPAHK
jgi:cytochrome c